MKSRVLSIALTLCATLLSTSLAFAESLEPHESVIARSCARNLALCISAYNDEFKKGHLSQNATPYPEKLTDLVRFKILTQSEFDKIRHNLSIQYFKPSLTTADPQAPIIFVDNQKFSVFGSLSGELRIIRKPQANYTSILIFIGILFAGIFAMLICLYRAQQDAAANP